MGNNQSDFCNNFLIQLLFMVLCVAIGTFFFANKFPLGCGYANLAAFLRKSRDYIHLQVHACRSNSYYINERLTKNIDCHFILLIEYETLKTLIWNKIAFQASKLLKSFRGGGENLKKTISKSNYQYRFLYPIYHCLL